MVAAQQNLNDSRDLTTPLSGIVCHPRARTVSVSVLKSVSLFVFWSVFQKSVSVSVFKKISRYRHRFSFFFLYELPVLLLVSCPVNGAI